MKQMRSGRVTRLSLTAGLFVAVMALAQSTEPGRIDQNCQSLGKNWTNFNCPFDPTQRRCFGLEIAYEASPECAEVTNRFGGIVTLPTNSVNPSFGALDHYFTGTQWSALDFLGDVSFCAIDVCVFNTPTEISAGCCIRLCQEAVGGGSGGDPIPGSSCPR